MKYTRDLLEQQCVDATDVVVVLYCNYGARILLHPSIVLRPSGVPEKVDVNQERYSHQKEVFGVTQRRQPTGVKAKRRKTNGCKTRRRCIPREREDTIHAYVMNTNPLPSFFYRFFFAGMNIDSIYQKQNIPFYYSLPKNLICLRY